MKKEIITSEKLRKPHGVYSNAVKVKADNLLFIKGITARDKDGNIVGEGDIKAQTRQIFENMKIILEAAGGTLDNIVKMTLFVTDINQFKEIHEVRAEYFIQDYPASTMVQVSRLASENLLIEIEAIAALD
jgi:2-iminobutanoate/2-iminopropanoate deaminase